MKQPIKIQINSLEALNRLIGDDPELEMEIRRSTVKAFARQYMKEITAGLVDSLRDAIVKRLFSEYKISNYQKTVELRPEYIKIINQSLDKDVWPRIHELFDVPSIQKRIDDLIKEQTDVIVGTWTKGEIQKAIQEGVRQTLINNLDLINKEKP